MEWNEEEVARYIVGRLKKDHGKEIPSAIIKLILDYESDYMQEAGMTMTAEEHDALLNEESALINDAFIALDSIKEASFEEDPESVLGHVTKVETILHQMFNGGEK
jgi:hypothetical protein